MKFSLKFHAKDKSMRNMTHTALFPNQDFSILCLFVTESHSDIPFKINLLEKYDILPFKSYSKFYKFGLILS